MKQRLCRLASFALGAAALVFSSLFVPAHAQGFPQRPVTIIVPAPPGGTTDLAARALVEELGKALGQPIIIENRSGANGIVGAQGALAAKPDGHTLYMAFSGFHVISPNLAKLPYDPIKDFQPVALIYMAPEVLVVRSSFEQIKTFQDLVAYAKANPGKLNYGSAGNGSVAHVGMEMFKGITQINITHVPYRGTGQILTDLLGGQVDLALVSVPPLVPQIQAGKLRPLLFTSTARQTAFPDVPTSQELGLKNFGVSSWFALYAHRDAPKDAIERIASEVRKIMAQPAFKQRAADQGAEAVYMGPAQLGTFTQAEYDRWAGIIKAANIKIE
jgi:tripartite-type tricarboxylate transporter receptor subunit TctC